MTTYPVHVDAQLETGLSRWLWLFKWVLVIPHYFVLAFLWIAFMVMSVVAFFAILFTGRYPRGIFEFNVGVLRWSWRVAYYAYGALGTDRYPPFTLHEVPDYPAHLEVEYPEHLSRGLVLVKWWLLAIPHYIVVGLLVGGTGYAATKADGDGNPQVWSTGLIGILVFVAGVLLLFTGRYPQQLFDFILGLNRWVLRVAGYAGLMTDKYPPFALDQGGHEGGAPGTAVIPPPSPPASPPPPAAPPSPSSPASPLSPPTAGTASGPASAPPPVAPGPAAPPPPPPGGAPPGGRAPRSAWTAGRVVSVVIGSVLLVIAFGLGLAGTALLVADQTARDDAGFLMSRSQAFSSPTFAIASSNVALHADAPADFMPQALLGDAKLSATPTNGQSVFIGVGPTSQVRDYLAGVQHETVIRLDDGRPVYRGTVGAAPEAAPDTMDFWVAQSAGQGTQQITWPLENGDWTAVVMNADGSSGIAVDVKAGAEVPALTGLVVGLLTTATIALVLGIVLVTVPLRGVSKGRARP